MSPAPSSGPSSPAALQHTDCDVCSVALGADGVVIAFGLSGPAAADPRALGASLRHRVVMAPATAAQLQDMLLAALSEIAPPRGASQP